MKPLAFLFLLGFALVAANPVPSTDLDLTGEDDLAFTLYALAEEDDDGPKTELGKKLRDHLDEILTHIKDAIDKGKALKEDYVEKARQIRQKLKDMKEDIGKAAKDLIKKIRERGGDYFKKMLEKIFGKKDADEIFAAQTFMADDDEDVGPTTELGKKLQEHLDEILEKMKEAIERGKTVKEEYIEKMKEIRDKLKEMREGIGKKARDLMQKIKDQSKDYFKKLLENIGISKRDIDMHVEQFLLEAEEDHMNHQFMIENRAINFKEMLRKLRDHVKDVIDVNKLKEKVEDIFGKGNEYAEMLIKKLKEKNEKAKQWLLDYIDKFYEDQEEGKRSVKEVWEKVKNYFKDLHIELKERYAKFGEWALRQYEKGLEKGKNKVENMKKLAKEFMKDFRVLSRDVIDQAKEFFKEYKDDLGTVYEDFLEKLKEIRNN